MNDRDPVSLLSVVYTHWAMNPERSDIMRTSLESLINTAPEAEIIVADNGGSLKDSAFLLGLTDQGKLASYTRYRKNMDWPYARNDALRRASRHYICIADNDILFEPGWAEECIDFLDHNQGDLLATPIAPDPGNTREIRWVGERGGWRLNTRAGSNVFVMRRPDFERIGMFDLIAKSGSKYVDRYVRMGYVMGVMPHPKAFDMGFRAGADFTVSPAELVL